MHHLMCQDTGEGSRALGHSCFTFLDEHLLSGILNKKKLTQVRYHLTLLHIKRPEFHRGIGISSESVMFGEIKKCCFFANFIIL